MFIMNSFRRIQCRIFYCSAFLVGLGFIFASISTKAEEDNGEKHTAVPVIEIITFKDPSGLDHEEYAFRPPHDGLPTHLLEMFCVSIKLRLYWDVFRQETKETHRKGFYLRRMARLARHIYADIRDADKPFKGEMLLQPDEWLKAPLETGSSVEKALDKLEKQQKDPPQEADKEKEKLLVKIKDKVVDIKKSLSPSSSLRYGKLMKEFDDNNKAMQQLEQEQDRIEAQSKMKSFLKHWAPKLALGVYTRVRTMWWLMMSCLFAKYYLWDPALDEFIKLQRNLVMWPKLQLAKMHELDCKPIRFFKRILDTCKLLNPLMRIDFGQFSLDKTTRFKSDQS